MKTCKYEEASLESCSYSAFGPAESVSWTPKPLLFPLDSVCCEEFLLTWPVECKTSGMLVQPSLGWCPLQ